MQVTITAGEVSVQVRAVRLADRRIAAPVPPALEALLAERDVVTVDLVVHDPDGRRHDMTAGASIVRSGRAWTEARGRMREARGWARRFARSPVEVVVLSPRD